MTDSERTQAIDFDSTGSLWYDVFGEADDGTKLIRWQTVWMVGRWSLDLDGLR